ncbi:MAG: RidA family protein [Waddliaceae bacterium]|jgi:2-iminobutanoate/2-iminopropanoate deaminase|nr:RidA family protein [Waddliaceae bacterium]MBT3578627.1 RidA family protein [Waddliaceae bacterium]MBT4445346.1 RidA family protein [Waddliaceae bacterium]MBT6928386.1 RidA family protein [Waddliaceae bacterium]MBT7265072.1 RidA family protein [Waddliaceae bacterium]
MTQKITTEKAPKAIGPYSQAVVAGGFVFVSGQVPIDPDTGALVDGDITTMAERILDNIENVLEAAGCGMEDVVRVDIFMKDLNDFVAVNDVYAKRFTGSVLPARQTVEVSRLPIDAVLEMSCVAVKK